MDTLETMKFEYDPQSDAEYQRDAAGLENQVAQMMVGRGGLYSSVASSALQSGLINLQLNKTAQKYEEFKAERDFTFQMAQAERQANTDNFNKIMAIKGSQLDEYKFKAQQKQQELENQYKALEFKMRQEEIAYNKMVTERNYRAQQAQNATENNAKKAVIELTQRYQVWDNNYKKFDKLSKQWATTNEATKEISDYFSSLLGEYIPIGSSMGRWGSKITNKSAEFGNMQKEIEQDAFALGQYSDFTKMFDRTYGATATGGDTKVTKQYDANGNLLSSSESYTK
jgi:hypothetical protein